MIDLSQKIQVAAERVKRAIESPQVARGIATAYKGLMQRHIADGAGRHGRFLPLNPLSVQVKDSKGRIRTVEGSRNGGQPLRDTGYLMRSLTAKGFSANGRIVLMVGGPLYGAYQNYGFSTKGPNFIPLTRGAKRRYSKGTAMMGGKRDFIIAWNGVTVPARNFIETTRADMDEIGRTLFMGLKNLLEGR